MAITSADFRAGNKILFKAPIITHHGFDLRGGRDVGGGDYIDFNSSGRADYLSDKGSAFGRSSMQFVEPGLKIPLAELKKGAQGEVLTADQLYDEHLLDVHASWGSGGHELRVDRINPRNAGVLVQQFAPLDRDASFAIDLTTNEFLIYRPQ